MCILHYTIVWLWSHCLYCSISKSTIYWMASQDFLSCQQPRHAHQVLIFQHKGVQLMSQQDHDKPHMTFNTQPSPFEIGLPRNLKGQSHFLVPVMVTSKSFLYFLYFPLLSQPNNTNVFLPCWPVALSDLSMTITSPKEKATFRTHSSKWSIVTNT